MLKKTVGIILAVVLMAACAQQKKFSVVKIETDMGVMKVRLYDQTPKHKENFKKLAQEGYYDGTLFHRVINQFMIQGGDPDSKNAEPGKIYGDGGPAYTIEAEFVDSLFHKKGALAAARKPDQANPLKASSGSQFYIVQGRVYSQEELDAIENQRNMKVKSRIFKEWIRQAENAGIQQKIQRFQQMQQGDSLQLLGQEIDALMETELEKLGKFAFTDEQREVYTTVGGIPFLDGEYTVFGEVIEGMEVLDKIAGLKTLQGDRPEQDVTMKLSID